MASTVRVNLRVPRSEVGKKSIDHSPSKHDRHIVQPPIPKALPRPVLPHGVTLVREVDAALRRPNRRVSTLRLQPANQLLQRGARRGPQEQPDADEGDEHVVDEPDDRDQLEAPGA